MEGSAISWTDHTFNVWIGCEHAPASDDPADTRTSPGCDHCYAELIDTRFGGGHWGAGSPRRFLSDAYWRKPFAWNARAEKQGERERVFCSSLADWAEVHPIDAVRHRQWQERERLWATIRATPWLDWLLLTKRTQRMYEMLPWATHGLPKGHALVVHADPAEPWPVPDNVWLGVTGENTEQLLRRVAILRRTPAAKRFISCEPMLEHIPAEAWDEALRREVVWDDGDAQRMPLGNPIDWLIVGDESGPHRRPAQLDWVRTAREAALRHGVTFHLKQLHVSGKKVHLPILDGRAHPAIPR